MKNVNILRGMNQRYQVIEGSGSGHSCCFIASVIDTRGQKLTTQKAVKVRIIAECFYDKDAYKLCDALNQLEMIGAVEAVH